MTNYTELLAKLKRLAEHEGDGLARECEAAISALIGERDDTEAERAHHDIMSQSLRVDLDLMRQRAEAAEARAAEYESVLARANTILGNMAEENEGAVFNRWPIHHEPLRADAKALLPVMTAALARKGD